MRKQTKLVAVASAAALLAIGASMTSFAATGWVEEDGQWYFYDKDGNRVEDEWKKSGNNWYWLDSEEDGAMAIDKLVEDDDDTYYVDGNGVMVRNTWVKVVNEDQDDDDDYAEYHYYYMQSNGKAYKAPDNGETRFKTIDGKKYAFDEDGKMLYGWVRKDDAALKTDDADWQDADYYLGNWDDGALKTGWQKIYVHDDRDGRDEDDYEYWFNFKSNGEKRKKSADSDDRILEKKINGKYYGFDEDGVMTYEWTLASKSSALATAASATNWRYFNNPEDGARVTKGWFKVVAPDDDGDDNTFMEYDTTFAKDKDGKGDAADENERWYYADGDGELYVGEIKKIKGKYYGFAPEGSGKDAAMLTGLCALRVKNTGEIVKLFERDMDSDDLDNLMDGEYEGFGDGDIDCIDSLYYFGNDEDHDGAMKTGNTTINLDGDSYTFNFSKSGGSESRGHGLNGTDDGKYIYRYGLKMKADSDDKYKVVWANGDIGDDKAVVKEIDDAYLRSNSAQSPNSNDDGDTIKYAGVMDKNEEGHGGFYLVNTSGNIVKNKTAAKDGNDWYYYVKNNQIMMYTNNKDLDNVTAENGEKLSSWKDGSIDNGYLNVKPETLEKMLDK